MCTEQPQEIETIGTEGKTYYAPGSYFAMPTFKLNDEQFFYNAERHMA
jgi:hypothetical protein